MIGRPTTRTKEEQAANRLELDRKKYHRIVSADRHLGELDPVVNPRRRKRAIRDFEFFRKTYHAEKFYLADSPDHKRLSLALVESLTSRGSDETRAYAFPRGTGKTTRSWIAAQWAMLAGHRRFGVLIGATAGKGEALLEAIVQDLCTNDLLLEDFPEVCQPLRHINGQRYKCKNQTFGPKDSPQLTDMLWSDEEFLFPNTGGPSAQSKLTAFGILSKDIRGQFYVHKPTGVPVRPDFILLDDVQNDENAISSAQCDKIRRVIEKSVLKLRAPKKPCSVFMPCTVIYENDVADLYTDTSRKKKWRGIRVKMLESMPTDMNLWEQYFAYRDELYAGPDDPAEVSELCNKWYRKHRKAMDAGAHASWKDNYDPGELSAIQHAMHLYHDDAESFFSECQNDPRPILDADKQLLPSKEMAVKTNGLPRSVPPAEAECIVAYVDVQKQYLYYCVAAFDRNMSCYVLDYGPFPKQNRKVFSKEDSGIFSFEDAARKAGQPRGPVAAMRWAFDTLSSELFGREWISDEGVAMSLDRMLIDARWGESAKVIKPFCRSTQLPILPALGYGFTATTKPITEDKPEPGVRIGENWKLGKPGRWRQKAVTIDTNRWKSRVHRAWQLATGDPGSLTLFDAPRRDHQMFADGQHAEYRAEVEGKWGKLDIWRQYPNRPDNEPLDCLVGCFVAASICGMGDAKPTRRRKRVSVGSW